MYYKIVEYHVISRASHPSNVGTPSWRVPGRRGTCRPRGCRALYLCRDAISRSLLFSTSRLSSAGNGVRKSKFSSKIPRANGEGNVKRCWWSMFCREQDREPRSNRRAWRRKRRSLFCALTSKAERFWSPLEDRDVDPFSALREHSGIVGEKRLRNVLWNQVG